MRGDGEAAVEARGDEADALRLGRLEGLEGPVPVVVVGVVDEVPVCFAFLACVVIYGLGGVWEGCRRAGGERSPVLVVASRGVPEEEPVVVDDGGRELVAELAFRVVAFVNGLFECILSACKIGTDTREGTHRARNRIYGALVPISPRLILLSHTPRIPDHRERDT